MALSTAITKAADSAYMFQEDDEETWRVLASNRQDGAAAMDQRLISLAERLEGDHEPISSSGHGRKDDFWNGIITQLQSNGFRYSHEDFKRLTPAASSASKTGASKPPVAFESDTGRKHLEATKALLGISQEQAVQVTLSALRSIDSDGSQFQSLLGTRDLLLKTLLYHQQQRLARLGIVTECLRLEQDPDASQRKEIKGFLDSLDSLFVDGDRNRGLFRRLLVIACAPAINPTREQLEPSKALTTSTLSSLQESSSSTLSATSGEWKSFCRSLLEELRLQQMRERTEAMEALLVLLYDRINGGVRRADYAVILLAFQSSFKFFTECPGDQHFRLTQLTGLICAESAALWRAMEPDDTWASKHPLFLEITSSSNPQLAIDEIQCLRTLLFEYTKRAIDRQTSPSAIQTHASPEAIAMLSFGLLLCLAHSCFEMSTGQDEGIWAPFHTIGMEMSQIANDEAGAFDFLYTTIENLTSPSLAKKSSATHDQLYDWQFSRKAHNLLLEDETTKEAAPESTAYTSIAREVLASSIASFEETILAIDQSNSCQNIGMLCNVGAIIFQNNPLLCQQFWDEWEIYLGSHDQASKKGTYPICKLLDSAHRMAVTALQAYMQREIPNDFFIQATAPFFQLLSSLCHTPDIIETTIAMLPHGLVREALLGCRQSVSKMSSRDESEECRLRLLQAFARLAQFGSSKSCLDRLRRSLEENPADSVSMDGPRLLSRLLDESQGASSVTEPVLAVMAHLLDGAPQQWALQLAREFIESQDSLLVTLSRFLTLEQPTVHSASLVLAELIEHLTTVVFCESFNEHDAIIFLRCVTATSLAASTALAGSLSVASPTFNSDGFSFETAQTIMQSLSNFLKIIRTVIELHPSDLVRNTALEMRDALIEALSSSTGLGQAIVYYATAPVALTLVIKLERAMEDESILRQVADTANFDAEKAKKYGAWHSVLAPHQGNPIELLAKNYLGDAISKLTAEDIDLEGITARQWTKSSNANAPIDTAFCAIRLLSLWASHIEDIISTHVEDLYGETLPLKGHEKELIETKSPFRLLGSLATTPMPCRRTNEMASVWEKASLSSFELLLPYLAHSDESKTSRDSVPSSMTLDLVHACLRHVQSISPRESVAESSLFRAAYRSARFSKLLTMSISMSLDIDKNATIHSDDDKKIILNGILGLRVLSSCVDGNPAFAYSMLYQNEKSLIPKLVETALRADVITSTDGSPLFTSTAEIANIRLATGCIAVLSALWKSVRSQSVKQSPSDIKLGSELDGQGNFMTRLVSIVTYYSISKDLESRIAPSIEANYARSTLMNYVALALELMSAELGYGAGKGKSINTALENFLLRDFLRSGRFIGFEGYEMGAAITVDFANYWDIKVLQPWRLLRCFPATTSHYFANDFYTSENIVDVSSIEFWISEGTGASRDSVHDLVSKLSVSYHFVMSELRISSAWSNLSEKMVLFSSELDKGSSSITRVFQFAQESLQGLSENLQSVVKVNVEISDFLLMEGKRMLQSLTELVLFFFDLGSQHNTAEQGLSLGDLIDTLSLLAERSETALSFAMSIDGGSTNMAASHWCISLEKIILSCVIVVIGLIGADTSEKSSEQKARLNESFCTLCRINCKVLQIICLMQNQHRLEENEDLQEALLCSISLFSCLFAGKDGTSLDDAPFLKEASIVMAEFRVHEEIISQAQISSKRSAALLRSKSSKKLSEDVRKNLVLVKAILDLLFSIAEVGSTGLLVTLPGPALAQLLVRNPLFRVHVGDEKDSMPVGYLLARGSGAAQSDLVRVGENDPLHVIWGTSMNVLAASMRASSRSSVESTFFDMSIEFLKVYRKDLVSSLKACGSRLSRNTLREINSILALVAELCKRGLHERFQRTCKELCDECISWSRFVVATLSKFLGASGTARELFFSIQQLESAEVNFAGGTVSPHALRHPLLADGIPSAQHEAVKFAHFASRCYQRVTKADFEASSATSPRLAVLAKRGDGNSDLETSSRLSVTNEFAVQMEEAAAGCVARALSILWRTHPVKYSFHLLSGDEASKVNTMSAVRPGMIIAFHPFEGSGLLRRNDGISGGFDGLLFGRVKSCDTVHRCWTVVLLQRGKLDTDGVVEQVVRAGQLAGLENTSKRKPVSSYSPAPNPMADLEQGRNNLNLGNLILILRWCHQESLLAASEPLDRGFKVDSSVRRLAEQAVALLCADLSIHNEIGSRSTVASKEALKLDAQIFELFADSALLRTKNESGTSVGAGLDREGRLKDVIAESAWDAVQPQVALEVQRYWKDKQEKERLRNEKRSLSNDAAWFTGMRRKGYSQKSAFRGFS